MHTSKFGQMQNLQKSIRTNAELTKICKKFGQMHAPLVTIEVQCFSQVINSNDSSHRKEKVISGNQLISHLLHILRCEYSLE